MHYRHLRQSGFTYSFCGPFARNKEDIQEIQDIFMRTNKIKLVFNMTWLRENLKI